MWRILLDRNDVYVTSFLGVFRPRIFIEGRKIKPMKIENLWFLDGLDEAKRQGIPLDHPMVLKFTEAWARGVLALRKQELSHFEFQTAMQLGGASGFRRIGQGLAE